MSLQHTVLMPFNRPKHFRTLREGMEGQGVTWVPLYDSDECENFFADIGPTGWMQSREGKVLREGQLPDWIKPGRGDLPKAPVLEGGQTVVRPTVNPGHWMCDAFLDSRLTEFDKKGQDGNQETWGSFFRKDHYVSFMTDDCFWAWNHWRKIQQHFVKRGPQQQEYGPAVIMTATMLGSNIIYAQHRRPNQLFHESTCRTFCTRFEALTVRADLLKEPRFGSFWAGDGIMVERLVEQNIGALPENVVFENNACVYFNALRPECWGFPESHQR